MKHVQIRKYPNDRNNKIVTKINAECKKTHDITHSICCHKMTTLFIQVSGTHHCFCSVQVFKYLETIAMWHNIVQSRKSKIIARDSLAITFHKYLNFDS